MRDLRTAVQRHTPMALSAARTDLLCSAVEAFEVVVPPLLRCEDVHHRVSKVEHLPFAPAKACWTCREAMTVALKACAQDQDQTPSSLHLATLRLQVPGNC